MESARQWLDKGNILNKNDVPQPEKLGTEDEIPQRSIDHLRTIQDSLADVSGGGSSELIAVAVDDMKVVSALMKLIVVYGIYRNLNDSEMVRLQQRLLNWPLPDKILNTEKLAQLSHQVSSIIKKGDDVANLLLISPFAADILALTQTCESDFNDVVSRIPTSNLYKLLIELQAVSKPSRNVQTTLRSLAIIRKDAVRSFINLVIDDPTSLHGEDAIDLTNIDKAVLVLGAVPPNIPAKVYIEKLGAQLFAILSKKATASSEKLLRATVLVVERLAATQPKLLGKLRNDCVSPFVSPNGSFSNSAGSILNLIKYSPEADSPFVTHIITKIIPSLWVLVATSGSKESIENSISDLFCRCISYYPGIMSGIIQNFLLTTQPGNLSWSTVPGKEPALLETVERKEEEGTGLLKSLDERIAKLAGIVKCMSDDTATQILITLMKIYSAENDGSEVHNPLPKLIAAKTIETLTQDAEVKSKLFSNTKDIMAFVFSILRAKYEALTTRQTRCSNARLVSSMKNIVLDDSDDESDTDEPVNKGNTVGTLLEDEDFISMALSLLGSTLMETLADSHDQEVSDSDLEALKFLATNDNIPKTVRAKAQFCTDMLDGTFGNVKEPNMQSDEDVLASAYSALREPLVPSRAYGIHLISQLLARKAITLKQAFDVYGNELGDEDSYVYLNAVKAIEESTKTHPTSEVLELLMACIEADSESKVDKALRAREALMRILTPGSVQTVSATLIGKLTDDLRHSSRLTKDSRIRLSSAALLGIIVSEFPLSVPPLYQTDIADCAIGILRHEKSEEDMPLRRAASVLCLEVINAYNEGKFSNIDRKTVESMTLAVTTADQETEDATLKDISKAVLESANATA